MLCDQQENSKKKKIPEKHTCSLAQHKQKFPDSVNPGVSQSKKGVEKEEEEEKKEKREKKKKEKTSRETRGRGRGRRYGNKRKRRWTKRKLHTTASWGRLLFPQICSKDRVARAA